MWSLPFEINDDAILFLLIMALCSLLTPLVQSIFLPLSLRVFAVLKQKVNANAEYSNEGLAVKFDFKTSKVKYLGTIYFLRSLIVASTIIL